jgi:hypothetical protein
MITDLKTSLLVNRQLPEFVREEYPKFILFLEAYYEFLDQNGYGKAKELKNLSDVDESLMEFEQQFFSAFLPFIPKNTSVSKDILIKNILPLYLAKGSEKSYRLLFRLLFDQEIDIETPGKQILRASDGKWSQENIIRIELDIYSEYVSDGLNNVYFLPYVMNKNEFEIYINDSLIEDYQHRKESKKIILNFIPNENEIIKILYKNFNVFIFNNLKIKGKTSGATSIVEKTSKKNIGGLTFFQLFLSNKNLFGNFVRSEILELFYKTEERIIPIYSKIYSDLSKIQIIDGGSNYNVGDPVIVRGPSTVPAIAVVDDVVSGTIDEISVVERGAGYKVGNQIFAETYDSSLFLAEVFTVDDSGINSSNTITFNIDVIENYENVSIDAVDYGFPVEGVENVESIISEVLTSNVITGLGPVTSAKVINSSLSTSLNPNFITETSLIVGNLRVSDLGCIGKIDIVDGGENYEVGDQLIFTNTISFSGQGANAVVSFVDNNGSIKGINIIDPGLSYNSNYLPEITLSSSNGSNAILVVSEIMGQGVIYSPLTEEGKPGQIKLIKLISKGSGYEITPGIDLSLSGSGNAIATAVLTDSFISLEGRWKTSDSLLSDDSIKLQGRDYYIPFSYVISSKTEFNKYRELLKKLIHPSGLVNYSKYKIFNSIEVNITNDTYSSITKTVSGTVSVSNGSNIITGTNTEFTIANTLGILTENDIIVVNDEIKSIVSVDNASSLTVNTEFNTTTSDKLIKIL